MSSDATGGTGLQLSRLPLRGCAKRIEESFVFYHGEKGVEFRPLGWQGKKAAATAVDKAHHAYRKQRDA